MNIRDFEPADLPTLIARLCPHRSGSHDLIVDVEVRRAQGLVVLAGALPDELDALAVARAALREPDLPAAQLEGLARTVRLLSDHRDHLVAERTRVINRLRWHLPRARPDP